MSAPQPPPSGRQRTQPPATNYPNLAGYKLPQALINAVNQSFQATYAVRDQTTANADAINHMVMHGTWMDRKNTAPNSLPDGALWFQEDLKDGVYQVRVDPKSNQLQWWYATGVVWIPGGTSATTSTGFTFTPTNGAAVTYALGLNDIGFMLLISGSIHVWNGTAWTT